MEHTAHTLSYTYESLSPNSNDIRLVEILPHAGDFHSPTCLRIHKVSLPEISHAPTPRTSITKLEILKSLPADRNLRVCLDGSFLFERNRDYGPAEPYETSWKHPTTGEDPNVGRSGLSRRSKFEPAYEGLSYVWAPAGDEEVAVVVASTTSESLGKILVRRNLAAALRHLRRPDVSRLMWIDAICINQDDDAERSDQVEKMGRIYRHARNVVVWLGRRGNNSQLALDAFRHLGEQCVYTEGGAWRTNLPGATDPTLARSSVPLPYDGATWTAIAHLLKRPWFERLWVWQEVRLADDDSKVQCGPDIVPLHRFTQAVLCMSDKAELPTAELRGLILDAVELMLPFSNQPFFRELQALNWKGCADPRDKIFGVLGAAPESIRRRMKFDYAKSAGEVYKSFSLTLLEEQQRLDFLDRCDLGSRQISAPTWVPDWSISVDRNVRLPYADIFYAGGNSRADVKFLDPNQNVLQATGVICGTVSFVGEKAPQESGELLSTVQSWQPENLWTGRYPNGEALSDAFVTLLGLGYFIERWPQCNSLLTVPAATELYQHSVQGTGPETNMDKLNFIRVRNRVFIRTENDLMGLTFSPAAMVGDILAVLLGCPSPMLLRPQVGEGAGHYQVVAPVFVYGLMDTEALLGPLPAPWRVRMSREYGFFDSMHFYNAATQTSTKTDPRIGPVPAGWEEVESVRTAADPWNFARFRNSKSGEAVNFDPRLSAVELEERGVKLSNFNLS